MRKRVVVAFGAFALAACGGGDAHDVVVTTTFTITEVSGLGPSPLDALDGQAIGLELQLDAPLVFHAMTTGCRQTSLRGDDPARAASGAAAATVTTAILDRLPEWFVTLELCEPATQSRFLVDAAIDELNLQLGCLTVPAAANVRDGNGDPVLTAFVGANCSATILDVVNNRALGARDFTIQIATGPAHVP